MWPVTAPPTVYDNAWIEVVEDDVVVVNANSLIWRLSVSSSTPERNRSLSMASNNSSASLWALTNRSARSDSRVVEADVNGFDIPTH